jgi:hypothetical protein
MTNGITTLEIWKISALCAVLSVLITYLIVYFIFAISKEDETEEPHE